jgi:hypothetical protein
MPVKKTNRRGWGGGESGIGYVQKMSSPATRKPGMMISQILMAIDNFSFVGEIHAILKTLNYCRY